MSVLRTLFAVVMLALLTPISVGAAEQPIPPPPTQWVTDTAQLLSPQTIRQLDEQLGAYETTTRHQVLVYIAPTTGDTPLEDWTVRAFKRWKVGRKGLDDGLILFVFPRDHKLRIEVGYGLEATVPDAIASRIIRETIEPKFRVGNPDRGITDGVDQLLRQIGGENSTSGEIAPKETPLDPPTVFLIILGIVGFVILAVRSPWLVLYLLVNILGGRGGSIGGNGGFQGGGGRSGGGGASGSW
jgi:uncharacterized protein